MLPLATPRLVLRELRLDDAAVVAGYRNDPAVSALQDWPVPYTEQMFVDRFNARGGGALNLAAGTNLGIEVDGALVGDVYVQLHDGAGEVGWSLTPSAQGRGYATEAATAIVEVLFRDHGATRLHASLHPANVASARVCEAIGMTFEALTRLSFRGREGWEDDLQYAITRDQWQQWVSRPRHPPATLRLVELGPANVGAYRRLATHRSQERLVAPMHASFTDALFPEVIDGAPVTPWMRGIEADGTAAGFVMLAASNEHHPEPYVWRLLIDRMHQRRGIGKTALAQVFALLRDDGHKSITVSWVDGPGSPRRFYEQLGFVPTGEIDDGEVVARLRW